MTNAESPRRRHSTRRLLGVTLLVVALLGACLAPAGAVPDTAQPTLLAAAPTSITSPSPAAGARAKKAATFGIGPATAKRIDGRPYLSYLASPGARLTDHVAVVNLAHKNVTLNLYAADAAIANDGAFGYLAKAAPRRDASAWITPMTYRHRPTITVPARSTVIVPVAITIPAHASPGDHAAGVITSLTSKVRSSKGELIDFEQRVALRTFIRVSGPLHPRLAIEKLQARYHGNANPISRGTVTVTYAVRDTGNVRLGAHQQVIISGLFGTKRPAKAVADVPLLLPGSVLNVSVTVHGVLPQLSMRARVVLSPLTVAGDVDPGLPTRITTTSTFWAIPWTLVMIVAALLLLALARWAWRRRRRPPAAPPSGRHRDRPAGPDDRGAGSAALASQRQGART